MLLPVFSLLNFFFRSLFVQAECDLATSIWIEVFKNEMERLGDCLEDCKLTADDVPVLVDKSVSSFHKALLSTNF